MKHTYTAVRFRRLKRSYAGSSNEMQDFTSCTTRTSRTTWQGPLSNKQTFVYIPSLDLDNIALNF